MRITTLILALAAALVLPACGGDKNGGDKPTPVGDWGVDVEHLEPALVKAMTHMGAPAEVAKQRAKEAKGKAVMTWHVKDDGTWTTSGSMMDTPQKDAGTWKLEGDQLTVQWTQLKGKPGTHAQTVTWTGGAIEMKTDPGIPFAVRMVRK